MIARPLAALLLALVTSTLHAPAVHAQSTPVDSVVAAPVDSVAAAPVDSVAPATATRDYLAEARAAFTPENRAYRRERVAIALGYPLIGIAVPLLLLFTGVAQRIRDLANARAKGRWARALIFFTLCSMVSTVVMLPLDWYSGWMLEHRFSLSNQTLGAWLLDLVKAFAFQIVAVGVVPFLALVWWVIERQPKRWWLWFSLAVLPLATAVVLLQPLVFDPLFNKFTRL